MTDFGSRCEDCHEPDVKGTERCGWCENLLCEHCGEILTPEAFQKKYLSARDRARDKLRKKLAAAAANPEAKGDESDSSDSEPSDTDESFDEDNEDEETQPYCNECTRDRLAVSDRDYIQFILNKFGGNEYTLRKECLREQLLAEIAAEDRRTEKRKEQIAQLAANAKRAREEAGDSEASKRQKVSEQA